MEIAGGSMEAAMARERIVIIGAGVGGLSAAVDLSARGFPVTVLERQPTVGGKMRQVPVGGAKVAGGPTVFTMKWVFDELFADAGTSLSAEVGLKRAHLLARHAWAPGETLDLFASIDQSADAIGAFAGAAEAERFRAFCARTREVYETLETPFLRSPKPNPISLSNRVGLTRFGDLWRLRPFATLAQALVDHFEDPRLRQLYGRYATYCGSSPYDAPATLMLVAHVEQEGVWYLDGGMHSLAQALARVATRHGATIACGRGVDRIVFSGSAVAGVMLVDGEVIEADHVIVNADANAVATGLFGAAAAAGVAPVPPAARSLSACVWTLNAKAEGFPLAHHNVFFGQDYPGEFREIFTERRLPTDPTVYVCAQDRADVERGDLASERLLILVNAPADGDHAPLSETEIAQCQERTWTRLARSGLTLTIPPDGQVLTTPREFDRLFPATGGALYGRASHGWMASFQRADGRTRIPGLHLAGGSVHPGPGVPMAALSGRLAARSVLWDCASTSRSSRAVISGGMSTR